MIKNPRQIDELSKLLCRINYNKTQDSFDPAQIEECQQVVSDLIKATTSPHIQKLFCEEKVPFIIDEKKEGFVEKCYAKFKEYSSDPSKQIIIIKEIIKRSQSATPEELENLQLLSQEILDNVFNTFNDLGTYEKESNINKKYKSWSDIVDLETAAKAFNERVLPEVKRILKENYGKILEEGKMITQEDLLITGFSGYLKRLQRIGIKYNDVLKKLSYELSHNIKRWEYIVDLETAVRAFKDEILPEMRRILKQKYGKVLKEGEYPTTTELKDNGFGSYLGRLTKILNITYMNIIEELGYPIAYDYYRWRHVIDPETAAKAFLEDILPEVKKFLKEKYGKVLKEDEMPTFSEIQQSGFGGYFKVLSGIGLKYNDVLKKLGHDIRFDPNRWAQVTDIESAAKVFNEIILPKMRLFLKEKYGKILKEGETPTYDELVRGGFGGFITRINRFLDITYNDVLKESGHTPREFPEFTDIGTELHVILERINMHDTRENKYDSYYEIHPSNHLGQIHPDITIIVNQFLREKLGLSKEIKIINIDFSMANNRQTFIDKGNRGYQGKDRILIIVPWTTETSIKVPTDIPLRENVKILNPWQYAEFIGMREENLDNIIKTFEIAQSSNYDTTAREELNKLALESKRYLKEKYPSLQEEFDNKLKEMGISSLKNISSANKKLDDYFSN